MSEISEQLPLAAIRAEDEGRVRYRRPLVTYTNAYEEGVRTVWMSPQVEDVVGYRASAWKAEAGFLEEVVHPDDREAVLEDLRVSRARLTPFSRDYRLIARDGETVWIHDESVPVLDRSGRPEFIQGYFVDITERKQLEEALKHAQKAEAVAVAAGGLAHDVNNVLTAVAGYVQLAENRLWRGHPARADLGAIADAVQRLLRLTRQLLALSRPRSAERTAVDVPQLVRELSRMLEHVAGPAVRIELELGPAVAVVGDAGGLEQVLMNLVANARDAMPSGGRIRIRTARVASDEGEALELTVSDEGTGIDPELRECIFEPFFTTKDRRSGTGLGLSTAREVIEGFGGTIEVSSVQGEGSTFRILLPATDVG